VGEAEAEKVSAAWRVGRSEAWQRWLLLLKVM
jgi:hypothetical protein